jgi:hypothetical protein
VLEVNGQLTHVVSGVNCGKAYVTVLRAVSTRELLIVSFVAQQTRADANVSMTPAEMSSCTLRKMARRRALNLPPPAAET